MKGSWVSCLVDPAPGRVPRDDRDRDHGLGLGPFHAFLLAVPERESMPPPTSLPVGQGDAFALHLRADLLPQGFPSRWSARPRALFLRPEQALARLVEKAQA